MKAKHWLTSVMACAALAFAGSSQASLMSYQFGDIISPTAGSVDASVASLNFATLTVDTDSWTFRLTADDLSVFGSESFLGALAVDGVSAGLSITHTASGSGIAAVGYSSGGGPGGVFDFRFDLTGPKQDRLTDGEWVEWTVSGLSGLNLLGLHVQGIDATELFDGESSAWYAPTPVSPVPLPASVWLFGSALAGLFGFAKRRRGGAAA